MYGWMGTILRVDLTSGVIEKEPLSEELRHSYIGGRGINGRILYNELKPGTDGLDPNNRLIFGTGPLTGTAMASGRLNITAMSPLTGILGDSNAGSNFSPELKFAGYDHIVFTGKAEKPVYLLIENDTVEIRDAQHLWGKTTSAAEELIKKEVRDPRTQIASIGPAGERLVKITVVKVGIDGFCGSCGLGAVMGSKNLKAVAVRGTRGVKVANPTTFRTLALDLRNRTLQNPNYPLISTLGTTRLFKMKHLMGTLPIRNASQPGPFAAYNEISGEALYDKYVFKDKACFNCSQHCRGWYEVKDGPYAGLRDIGTELTAQEVFGTLCDISYAPAIYKCTYLCNEYGLDWHNTGNVIAAAIEWYEKGLISKKDTGGIELSWGNYEAVIKMIHKIANKEDIGELLSEGGVKAAEKLGRGAEKTITYSKGNIRTSTDLRPLIASQLGYAVSTRGADHLRGIVAPDPNRLDSYEGVAERIYDMQGVCTIADCLEVCKLHTPYSRMELSFNDMAEFFSAATGLETTEENLREIADRVWTLERAFIVREGITRKDDNLLGRCREESKVLWGPLKGMEHNKAKWDKLLDEYYDLVYWDKKTGAPTRAILEKLGLKDIANELEKMGKL